MSDAERGVLQRDLLRLVVALPEHQREKDETDDGRHRDDPPCAMTNQAHAARCQQTNRRSEESERLVNTPEELVETRMADRSSICTVNVLCAVAPLSLASQRVFMEICCTHTFPTSSAAPLRGPSANTATNTDDARLETAAHPDSRVGEIQQRRHARILALAFFFVDG